MVINMDKEEYRYGRVETDYINPVGVVGKVQNLSERAAQVLVTQTMNDAAYKVIMSGDDAEKKEVVQRELNEQIKELFLCQIILRRIEVMQLPIAFTPPALLCAYVFYEGGPTPGSAVVMLIDCLNKYEGKTVDVSMLCDLYPDGFYNEASFGDYIDNYLKTRKTKWSEVYGSRH